MSAHPREDGHLYAEMTRGEFPDEHREKVFFEARDDGWYVKTPEDDEFWQFTDECDRRTAAQLIRKKWSGDYNPDPDDFTDRS